MTQWPPPMPSGLAWFLAIYGAVGTTLIFSEPIRSVYRRWKAKRTAKQVDRLMALMRARGFKFDTSLLKQQWAGREPRKGPGSEYMFWSESRSDTPAPRSEEREALKHYSLKGSAAQYLDSLHEAEKEWLFPRTDNRFPRYVMGGQPCIGTVTFHPRYEVTCHLDGATWIWNQERFDWTVE